MTSAPSCCTAGALMTGISTMVSQTDSGVNSGRDFLNWAKPAPHVPVVPFGELRQFLRPLSIGFAHLPVGRVGVVPGYRFLQPVRGGRQPPCLIVEYGLHGAGPGARSWGWVRR